MAYAWHCEALQAFVNSTESQIQSRQPSSMLHLGDGGTAGGVGRLRGGVELLHEGLHRRARSCSCRAWDRLQHNLAAQTEAQLR